MKYGENFAWNHEVEPGRVVEAFLPAAGGIVLYSVSLHDGEGLCERNQGILHLIGERIRVHQLPVIVAGDFNFPVMCVTGIWADEEIAAPRVAAGYSCAHVCHEKWSEPQRLCAGFQ